MRWYKRNGEPYPDQDTEIGSKKWFELHGQIEKDLANLKYKRVAVTDLPNGYWVSTVWLGLDHSFYGGIPLIFETMIFNKKEGYRSKFDDLMERYSTEKEAVEGHKRIVKEVRRKLLLTQTEA